MIRKLKCWLGKHPHGAQYAAVLPCPYCEEGTARPHERVLIKRCAACHRRMSE